MALTDESLRAYLRDRQGVDVSTLEAGTPIFSSGLLDSFALVEVIAFLEAEGGFRMSASEVHLDHLDSIGAMLDFARSKTGSPTG